MVVRAVVPILVLLILWTPAAFAAEDEIEARDARIVEVTVYLDRAEVVEEATVDVPAGAATVVFENVPHDVDLDAFRVSARGVPATLGAVEIRERATAPEESPAWLEARDEVRRLERKARGLERGARVEAELQTFLRGLGKTRAERHAEDIASGAGDTAGIEATYALLRDKLRELSQSSLERETALEDLQEQLAVARARLETLGPGASIRTRVAGVDVEADRAGTLTLRLTYVTPAASWRPSYRATLRTEDDAVEWVSEGVVRQTSGRDWSDVDLRLSSASPSTGVAPPTLPPWVLRPIGDPALLRMAPGIVDARGALAETVVVTENTLDLAPSQEPVPSVPAGFVETDLDRSAYSVRFRVPGASDVPSDGSDHRVVLRQETLEATRVHRVVPGLDARAFLTAVTTSPAEYPLLAGPVRVFVDGAYLGRFALDDTGPDVELRLPFGADNRVEVVRVPEPERKSREGFAGKQRQVLRTSRTRLRNGTGAATTVVLEDRVPVSGDERIVVEIEDATTEGFRDSERRPGVKLWTLTLEPGEEREVVLEYTVRYPRDLVVFGGER